MTKPTVAVPLLSAAKSLAAIMTVALVACLDNPVSPSSHRAVSGSHRITSVADGYLVEELIGGPGYQMFVRGISGNGDLVGISSSNVYVDPLRFTVWPADGSARRVFGMDLTEGSDANAVNANGDVVGHFGGAVTLWPSGGGDPVTLGTLGIESSPSAINNSRDVVGYFYGEDYLAHAVIWPAAGNPRDLGSAGATSYYATAINSKGDVAGVSDTPDGPRATVWLTGEAPRNLETLFGGGCEVTGINDARDVVGFCRDANGFDHATLWAGAGTPRALGAVSGESHARAINNSGTIVGTSGSNSWGTVWPAGGAPQLLPASDGAVAVAINEAGQIAGFAYGRRTVIRWTPIAPPADVTPPEISLQRTPRPNGFGWNNTDVALTFTVEDKESGIEIATDCEPLTLKEEVTALRVICKARNNDGLSNFVELFVSIDKTAPDFVLPNMIVDATSPSGAHVDYIVTASDERSGMGTVECTIPSGHTFAAGTTLVGCTATDRAGNARVGSFSVTVLSAQAQAKRLIERLTNDQTLAKQPQLANLIERVLADPAQACKNLDKFIETVEKSKKISANRAAELVADARNMQAAMGCSNPLTERRDSGPKTRSHERH